VSLDRRRRMIEPGHPQLSTARQCELVSIGRSGFYHRPAGETPPNLEPMRPIDARFLETPWYGSRRMPRHLRREGHAVGRERGRCHGTAFYLLGAGPWPGALLTNPRG
jgi:putative transposase